MATIIRGYFSPITARVAYASTNIQLTWTCPGSANIINVGTLCETVPMSATETIRIFKADSDYGIFDLYAEFPARPDDIWVNTYTDPLSGTSDKYYVINFVDGDGNVLYETVPLKYQEADNLQRAVYDLRFKIKDISAIKNFWRWQDEELRVAVLNALADLNATPPYTGWSMANFPYAQWQGILMQGAMIFALIGQGILEIGKEFSFNDNGIALNIERSPKFQSWTTMLLNSYTQAKAKAKWGIYHDLIIPAGLKSAPIAFKLRQYSPLQYRMR